MFSKKYYLSSWVGVATAVFQQLTGIMCILQYSNKIAEKFHSKILTP